MPTAALNRLIMIGLSVFVVTGAVWLFAVNQQILNPEDWLLYLGVFVIPAAAVCAAAWMIADQANGQRLFGWILIVPSAGIWILSLLLVFNGFDIH